jgi:hypothetical protein
VRTKQIAANRQQMRVLQRLKQSIKQPVIDLRNAIEVKYKALGLLVPVSEVQRTGRDFDLSNLSRFVSPLLECRHAIKLPLHEARDVLENRCRRLASRANSDQNPYPLAARVLSQVTVLLLDALSQDMEVIGLGTSLPPCRVSHSAAA